MGQHQRFRTKQNQLRYPQLGGRHGIFYTDTMFSSTISSRGNKCAQVWTNDVGCCFVIPMQKKSEASQSLIYLIREIGIPSKIVSDNALELTDGKFKAICTEYAIARSTTEPHSPWQNKAELQIREVKRNVRSFMKYKSIPAVLWDYCAIYYALIRRHTAVRCPEGDFRCPIEIVTGHTPDISELVDYGLFDP